MTAKEVLEAIIPFISAVLGTGLVGAYFTYRINKSKVALDKIRIDIENKRLEMEAGGHEADEMMKIVELYRVDNDKKSREVELLKEKIDQTINENVRLQQEINDLRVRTLLIESYNQDFPFPMWLKDTEGRMLSLNTKYEEWYLEHLGLNRLSYIGKTDAEVHGEERGTYYKNKDSRVNNIKEAIFFMAPSDIKGEETMTFVSKYPRKVANTIVAIGGITFPAEILILDGLKNHEDWMISFLKENGYVLKRIVPD